MGFNWLKNKNAKLMKKVFLILWHRSCHKKMTIILYESPDSLALKERISTGHHLQTRITDFPTAISLLEAESIQNINAVSKASH